jgi:formyltetrahydrofolate deformylase
MTPTRDGETTPERSASEGSEGGEGFGKLLVTCPDRKGIVAALAQLLYGQGANILDSDQHTDPQAGVFFQRIRFDLAELRVDRSSLERAIGEVADRMGMTWRLEYSSAVKRMAIFVSKQDHCLYDLLLRNRAGELDCEIALIVSNHPDAESIADQFGIEYHVFPISKETKQEQERREIDLLHARRIDLVVMARYMQILSDEFINDCSGPIINIHHSFLPAFVGGKPYHQAHARGVKLIGATAHYATADLDEGPIIEQDVIRAGHRDSVRDLVRKGRDVERVVLSRAVRWHLEDRVLVYGNKTVVFS